MTYDDINCNTTIPILLIMLFEGPLWIAIDHCIIDNISDNDCLYVTHS